MIGSEKIIGDTGCALPADSGKSGKILDELIKCSHGLHAEESRGQIHPARESGHLVTHLLFDLGKCV